MQGKRGLKLAAVVFLMTLLFMCISCGQSEPETSVPASPPPSRTPPSQEQPGTDMPSQPSGAEITWMADGIIGENEYTNAVTYDGLEVQWNSDGEYVYVALKAQTAGWISLAIQPGTAMKDADMVLGFVAGGQTTVIDQYSTGSFGPHRPDAELGGSADIIEYAGMEEGGYTILEFKRALVTGDSYDHPLSAGANKIIWAYGSSDEVSGKHSHRGYGTLDL